MALDLKGAATRKIGPLPAWGWGIALGGGFLLYRAISGGKSGGGSSEDISTTFVPAGPLPTQATQGFLEALPGQLAGLQTGINDVIELIGVTTPNPDEAADEPAKKITKPKPASSSTTSFDLGTYVIGLRDRFPDIASLFKQAQKPGESATERRARLEAERLFIEQKAGLNTKFDIGTYVRGLRDRYPTIAKLWTRVQKPGESSAERAARLLAERAFIESKAGISAKP
jgi:hypothetical protein